VGWPVNTVAAGGLPVIDATAVAPMSGKSVIEAPAGYGVAVTKVTNGFGMPVIYVSPPLLRSTAVKADVGLPHAARSHGVDPDILDEQIAEAIDDGDVTIQH
jgi:hypothetical protein